jgi:hypothetical protein
MLDFRANYIKNLDEREEKNRRQELADAYEWLSATDYSSYHGYLLLMRNGFPGTSMWLLQRNDMISWQDPNSEVSVFWLHGILGSGIYYHDCKYIMLWL